MLTRNKINKIKQDYLYSDLKYNQILTKYKLQTKELEELEKLPSFRKRIIDWVVESRCNNCDVWKTKDQYNKSWITKQGTQSYQSKCRYCNNLIKRNQRKLDPEVLIKERIYKKTYRENQTEEQKQKIRDQKKARRLRNIDRVKKQERAAWKRKVMKQKQVLIDKKRKWEKQ